MIITLITEEDDEETCRQLMDMIWDLDAYDKEDGAVLGILEGDEHVEWLNKTVHRKYTFIKGEDSGTTDTTDQS